MCTIQELSRILIGCDAFVYPRYFGFANSFSVDHRHYLLRIDLDLFFPHIGAITPSRVLEHLLRGW